MNPQYIPYKGYKVQVFSERYGDTGRLALMTTDMKTIGDAIFYFPKTEEGINKAWEEIDKVTEKREKRGRPSMTESAENLSESLQQLGEHAARARREMRK